MKIGDIELETMSDGDTLILKGHQDDIIHRCCDCGLHHHMKIERLDNKDIGFTFTRLDGDFEFDVFETTIVKGER